MPAFVSLLALLSLSAQGADCGVLNARYVRAAAASEAAAAAYGACVRRRDQSDCAAAFNELQQAQTALTRVVESRRRFCLPDVRGR